MKGHRWMGEKRGEKDIKHKLDRKEIGGKVSHQDSHYMKPQALSISHRPVVSVQSNLSSRSSKPKYEMKVRLQFQYFTNQEAELSIHYISRSF